MEGCMARSAFRRLIVRNGANVGRRYAFPTYVRGMSHVGSSREFRPNVVLHQIPVP
jgi:hypothetical protein